MDLDPAVEPYLDTFSLIFPLPYRVASTIVFGVWAWGLNLHYLKLVKIDVPALIRYPHRNSPTAPSHHLSTYRFAVILTVPLVVSILLFWLLTRFRASAVLQWELLPNIYLLFLFLAFAIPSNIAYNGRKRFLTTLRRVSIGGIAQLGEGKFGDILMADVLTSYAKVLGELFVALCMMVTREHSTALPNRNCGGHFVVPFLISIPFLIRLRQCLIEFMRVRKGNSMGTIRLGPGGGGGHQGWGGVHLANALKYSSALPVIVLSSLQRDYDLEQIGMTEAGLSRLWLVSVFVNSFYSFYWDVARDWDLQLFSPNGLLRSPATGGRLRGNSVSSVHQHSRSTSFSSQTHANVYPYGLRRHRYFHSPGVYYTAIFVDLLLRCTWSFKLSPHLDHFNDLEGGIWAMELLEVFRRWMWLFLRIETEWVRGLKGAGGDERREQLLLGEFGDVEANSWTRLRSGDNDTDGIDESDEEVEDGAHLR